MQVTIIVENYIGKILRSVPDNGVYNFLRERSLQNIKIYIMMMFKNNLYPLDSLWYICMKGFCYLVILFFLSLWAKSKI